MEELVDLGLGRVTVLFGEKRGKYPQGNTVLVRGDEESLLIDPARLMPLVQALIEPAASDRQSELGGAVIELAGAHAL